MPALWGYTLPASVMPQMAESIALSRLIVVFDLDETLLLASTTETLGVRLQAARETMCVFVCVC